MRAFQFRLAIPSQEYLVYYQGAARNVVVTLASGQNLQFPAEALRPFVTHAGVYGMFRLEVNEDNKLERMTRIGD